MFVGLVIYLMIVRFIFIKIIFLIGYMFYWFLFIFVVLGVEVGLNGGVLIVFVVVLLVFYWLIMFWLLRKYVFDVIGDDFFILGYLFGCLVFILGFVVKLVGNKEKFIEDINIF